MLFAQYANRWSENFYLNCLMYALMCIGFSLHPIQDMYSHTDDVVHRLGPIYYHFFGTGVDNAQMRMQQALYAGQHTRAILRSFYISYSILRKESVLF